MLFRSGRSVKRSGLRNTGGIYLVSVHRAATGNVHRAVGPEFVLNTGDVLYFTGLVEGFEEFCAEHGMEILTNDLLEDIEEEEEGCSDGGSQFGDGGKCKNENSAWEDRKRKTIVTFAAPVGPVPPAMEDESNEIELTDQYVEIDAPVEMAVKVDLEMPEIGCTKESLMQCENEERLKEISRMRGKECIPSIFFGTKV